MKNAFIFLGPPSSPFHLTSKCYYCLDLIIVLKELNLSRIYQWSSCSEYLHWHSTFIFSTIHFSKNVSLKHHRCEGTSVEGMSAFSSYPIFHCYMTWTWRWQNVKFYSLHKKSCCNKLKEIYFVTICTANNQFKITIKD